MARQHATNTVFPGYINGVIYSARAYFLSSTEGLFDYFLSTSWATEEIMTMEVNTVVETMIEIGIAIGICYKNFENTLSKPGQATASPNCNELNAAIWNVFNAGYAAFQGVRTEPVL